MTRHRIPKPGQPGRVLFLSAVAGQYVGTREQATTWGARMFPGKPIDVTRIAGRLAYAIHVR